MRTEPPVSVPSATRAMPVATAAALPPLDPPDVCAGWAGFRTAPKWAFPLLTPYANSCRLTLATVAVPAASSAVTTGADTSARSPPYSKEPCVVRTSATSMLSLTARVYPASGPSLRFAWRSEEHTSELQSRGHLVWRLLLDKK